jgi:putative ABC transport system permease protein
VIVYRSLLRLLPRERRVRDGEAMAAVFAELQETTRRERGWLALGVLWMKETSGLVRFGVRERFTRRTVAAGSSPSPNSGGWNVFSELKWAWRAVRARGWRALLIVALLAVALAANAVMFAVADSLVFNRVPFPHADRIVEIQRPGPPGEPGRADSFFSAALLTQWRNQTDLFSSVHGYLQKTIFVVGDGMAELVGTVDVTPGLIELLGVAPRWGRSIATGDELDTSLQVVLISEPLARKRFGSPELAVGRRIETTADPLMVVGVMPASFSFPNGGFGIWRALDPQGPLTRNFAGVTSIARMAPTMSMETLAAAMAQRSAAIGAAAGRSTPYTAQPGPFFMSAAGQATTYYMLLGAALCLLLTACANVASLELAAALQRARTYAVQLALGASRGLLARMALIEGLGLIVLAIAVAAGLTWLGIQALNTYLPARMLTFTANPVDFDTRVMLSMAGGALLTWLLVSLPTVLFASRARLLNLLKVEDRSTGASRIGGLIRRGLTVAEVAIALLLVTGGTLYARSYQSLLAIDKGFDSRNLAQLDFTIPVQYYAGFGEMPTLAAETIRRVTSVPGVLGATWASAPPSMGNSPTGGLKIEIDDRLPTDVPIAIGLSFVDATYQTVIGLPLRRGRWLAQDDPPTAVVITEAFAQRFWPGVDPVGHRFRPSPNHPWYDVVGVVGDIRTNARRAALSSDRTFFAYSLRPEPTPPPPPKPGAPPPRATGGSWRFLNVTVRMDSPDRADAVLSAARAIDRRVRVELQFVDDAYSGMHADTLLATRVVGAFAGMAFLVAMVGVYGVMAFLVAGRTREIGIRMALGADRRDISRLVLRSAVTMVGIGAVIGIAGALVAARWTASQFFGVTATSPWIYLAVTAVVVLTSILATWRPARSAARVDPAITLRSE